MLHNLIDCSTSGSEEDVTLYFEICMVWALRSPLPGPPWGPQVPYEHLRIPAPEDDSCQVWLKSNLAYLQEVYGSYFLHRAPSPTCYPPPPPMGATLGTATNNLHSSSKKVSTLCITWLFYLNWIWRRSLKFTMFWPFGALPPDPHRCHMYHMNNFESPAPKDDSCHVWLKSDHAFSRRRWNSYFLTKGPLPNLLPSAGAHWGHPGNCHEQLLFFT